MRVQEGQTPRGDKLGRQPQDKRGTTRQEVDKQVPNLKKKSMESTALAKKMPTAQVFMKGVSLSLTHLVL